MNKKQLAEEIARRLPMKKYQASHFVEQLTETIGENLARSHKVVISKFGTFSVRRKKPKRVLNPVNKRLMTIPETKVVKFIAAENLKKLLEGNG